jgi:hypothetical protein
MIITGQESITTTSFRTTRMEIQTNLLSYSNQ